MTATPALHLGHENRDVSRHKFDHKVRHRAELHRANRAVGHSHLAVGMTSVNLLRHRELSPEGLAELGPRNACDRLSIHLSGAIQPHGFLLAVDPVRHIILAASANFPRPTGCNVPLGLLLSEVLGAATAQAVLTASPAVNPHDVLPICVQLPADGQPGKTCYDMVAHKRGPVLVLEFEQNPTIENELFAPSFQRQRNAVKALLTIEDCDEICHFTAQEIRQLTGYDRVMIYRFEPDAHGCVIAEASREDAESLLGLHYPAGDIPRQARAMYMQNWIRVIADVGYDPVPILVLPEALRLDQLDLSMSVLRSVSPLHIEYLRNMGVGATMAISLIVDNQLWGMIACHHDTPKRLTHIQRLACEALGQLVSVRLRSVEAAKHHQHVRDLGQMAAQVVTAMAAAENPAAGAAVAGEPLLGMVGADGAVLELDGIRVTAGNVPNTSALDLIVPRLARLAGSGSNPVATDALSQLPGMPEHQDGAAATGALYLPLPGRSPGFILWLRGERAHTVRWAGRWTAKPDDGGNDNGKDASLTPRASFEEWLQDVRGHSLPWRAWEIATAVELAQAMPEVLQHRAQNRLVRLALHDPLTGLPNRVQLLDRLDRLLACRNTEPGESEKLVGVLFFDIDGFKGINDTRGHQVGDELLVTVARRVTTMIRLQDLVARLGGDEFVVLLPNTDVAAATAVGQRIVEDFRASLVLGGELQSSLTVSVGVAVVPVGTEPGEALRQADTAMYHAKRSGRDQVAIFDPAVGTAASLQLAAAEELRVAIQTGEITVHYQPIWKLSETGDPVLDGFEALARWLHPTRGFVPPDEFIKLAEETGLIGRLGDAVVRQALRQLQAWPDRKLHMAINVSVRQLLLPNFARHITAQLVEFGITPARICLEITESQMMEQPKLALAVLTELVESGLCIAIDDFGTGFSSMAYLRDLPAAVLKIDRSFVSGLPHNYRDVAVVSATLQLAHSLGMRTVAEGVETTEQLTKLRDLGSDFAQGYLLGKPVRADAVVLKQAPAPTPPSTAIPAAELIPGD